MTFDDSLLYGAYGCAAVIAVCWLLGVVTKEHSWVDRIWSIVPIGYAVWFASRADFSDARTMVMTALVTLWGVRLTLNFARKGGYAKGGEDYRWPVLRQRMTRWQWELFAILFIAGFQNVLLYLLSWPIWVALRGRDVPFGIVDALLAALFLSLLLGETVADQQQWEFHRRKKAMRERGETPDPPFLTTGLFRYSRHPNSCADQPRWGGHSGCTGVAPGEWPNAPIGGPPT
ncbi:MAG: DUF1295 domain-containing protein, partial [Sandaracinaceae bacterium]